MVIPRKQTFFNIHKFLHITFILKTRIVYFNFCFHCFHCFFQKISWKLVKTDFLLFLYVQLTIYQNEKKEKWKYLHVSKLHLLLFLKILEWSIYFYTSTIFPVINLNWLRSFDLFFISQSAYSNQTEESNNKIQGVPKKLVFRISALYGFFCPLWAF